jgi:hypothetical protein
MHLLREYYNPDGETLVGVNFHENHGELLTIADQQTYDIVLYYIIYI